VFGHRSRSFGQRRSRKHAVLSERGRRVIGISDERRVARALDDDAAFARLRRFFGVDVGNRKRRARQRAEMPFDRLARSLGVEIADHERRRIIGMVIRVVEFAQPLCRDALDIGAPTDRRMVIRVFAKSRSDESGIEYAARVVVVAFEFVTHDRHLGAAIRIGDEGAAHAIGFEFDREFEIARRNGLEIQRSIEPRRRILARTDFVHDIRKRTPVSTIILRCAFEEHVFEQMRRPGIADGFVPRADPVDDHQRRHGRRRGRDKDDFKSVLEDEFVRRRDRGSKHPGTLASAATKSPANTRSRRTLWPTRQLGGLARSGNVCER